MSDVKLFRISNGYVHRRFHRNDGSIRHSLATASRASA